jgi:hypothetical protein
MLLPTSPTASRSLARSNLIPESRFLCLVPFSLASAFPFTDAFQGSATGLFSILLISIVRLLRRTISTPQHLRQIVLGTECCFFLSICYNGMFERSSSFLSCNALQAPSTFKWSTFVSVLFMRTAVQVRVALAWLLFRFVEITAFHCPLLSMAYPEPASQS